MLTIKPGESGYFSEPTNTLDPFLFEGTHLLPDARERLTNLLLDYLAGRYNNPRSWTRIWLAGSGISYQWSAARGNGDLDVLFGIDYDKFVNDNPEFAYDTRQEITDKIDSDLRSNLWPNTAHTPFYAHKYLADTDILEDVKYYEVTFFLNPGVDDSMNGILTIHPYAAYDLTSDEWTTKPAKPGSPVFQHPAEFSEQADRNLEAAKSLVDRYNHLTREGASLNVGQEANNRRSKALVVAEASNLLDSIHLGRRAAFTGFGQGYGDFYNYQWQRAKQDGIVTALNQMILEN